MEICVTIVLKPGMATWKYLGAFEMQCNKNLQYLGFNNRIQQIGILTYLHGIHYCSYICLLISF